MRCYYHGPTTNEVLCRRKTKAKDPPGNQDRYLTGRYVLLSSASDSLSSLSSTQPIKGQKPLFDTKFISTGWTALLERDWLLWLTLKGVMKEAVQKSV